MMNTALLGVALRHKALYVPNADAFSLTPSITPQALALVACLAKLGYGLEENALHALNSLTVEEVNEVAKTFEKVYMLNLNWAPMVKNWLTPTGVTEKDYLMTMFANLFPLPPDAPRLPCGHYIPAGTFPLARYNGCPFCGTQFTVAPGQYNQAQGSKLKILTLWTDDDLKALYRSMLSSPVPLDATQRNSLAALVKAYGIPENIEIRIKETLLILTQELKKQHNLALAKRFYKTPADILRWLWFDKTGQTRVIPPAALIRNAKNLGRHVNVFCDRAQEMKEEEREKLKLHYSRPECALYAQWLNDLPMNADAVCENMHPHRQMWVRVIRALRLTEYAKRSQFAKLAPILDKFYRKDYTVWAGEVDVARLESRKEDVLALLSKRPGAFARVLFSAMLRYGPKPVLNAFETIMHKVPVRLVLALGMYAEFYFMADPFGERIVSPLGGAKKTIPVNWLLRLYTQEERQHMVNSVRNLYLKAMFDRFKQTKPDGKDQIFIDPQLFNIPVPVGERSDTVQDASYALPGQQFPVQGDTVRLFMQWGKGLPKQHLDMDLSCYCLKHSGESYVCCFYDLTVRGAQHSGDIITIPDQVGTAEYIELNIPELEANGVKFAVFTCNAYSCGSLAINLTVGWMNSAYPMTVNNETGVAYDPSTVDHMVRVPQSNLSKGLVFGVLAVDTRTITWLEMPFDGQLAAQLNTKGVEQLLEKLRARTTLGEVLEMKAKAQGLTRVDKIDSADNARTEIYTLPAVWLSDVLSD